jgi:hypothetical protein
LTAVLAAAVMFGPLSAGPAAGAAKQPPAGAVVLGQLRGILAQLADEYGEPDPTHMRMVETISPALGDLRPSIPVYVVVANGHFAERDTLWPNLRAQTGTTLEIVLTRPAEEVDSWRLMRHNAELRKLGTVQALDVQPPPAITPPVTAPILAQLQAILVAHAPTDQPPTHMQAVATNSFAAASYLTSGFAPDQPAVPVYALCAKGMSDTAVSVPPGYHGPSTPPTTFCLIVLAPGLEVTTFGTGSHLPDLAKLGQVQTLAPAPAPQM